METRKKKKIDYSEMLGAEDDYSKIEKNPPSTSKGKKRKNESSTGPSKPNKSSKRDMKIEDIEPAANWEEITVKEEVLNSDSDDLQSEDEDIEKQMEDASNFLNVSFQNFIPAKSLSKKHIAEDIKLPIDIYLSNNSKVGDKCSLINYVHGYLKILLNGHVYFCNRVVDNVFYWQCDQNRDCISQAVTMFNDDKHSIKSLDEHNHPPTVNGNCCLKDDTIAMYLPAGIRQNSFEKCDVKKSQYLVRNGYFYIKRKTEDDIDFWLCERHKSEGCKGGILTIKYEEEYYVKYASEHNHVNDLDRQYKCIDNDEELQANIFHNDYTDDKVEVNEEDLEGDLNDDANDFDNDNYNDANDPDYEVESDQEIGKDQIFIKKEAVSEGEDDIAESDFNNSKDETTEIFCEFINSQRGNPKLCINGYMYTLNRKSKSSYWTCEFKKKKSIDCRAMACTAEKDDGKHVVKKMTEHNHPPRTDRKIIGQILNRIREKCIERTDLTASEVVESETGSLPEELRGALPSRNAIYRMISRKRRLEEAAMGSKIYERKELKKLKCDLDVETSFEVKDAIICQTVESSRGNNKLIVDDYLFNLSRVAGNNHYWRCEQRLSQKCVGFAITNCKDGVHYLKNIREHNHESQRNRKFVVQAMNTIKEMALKTDEDATVIVEDALKDISEDVLRELPTKETLIRKVNRTRYLYKPKPAIEEPTNKDEPADEKSHIYDIGIEVGTACQLFSPTNKGNFKLNLNGYFYHKNRINNGMHYWQCEDNKHYKCKGFAVTVCTDDSQHILKKAKKHNHPAKQSRQDIAQIIQKIKEKAKTTDEDSSLIYNDEVEHLPEEIKNLLPQRCSILSMINRIRKQHCDGDDKKEPIKYDDEYEHIFEIKQLPDTECEFVESKRGFEKLTIEGYLYCREAYYKEVQIWRCMERKNGVYPNCRGYAQTYRKDNKKHYLKNAKNHNHPPNKYRIELFHLMNRMKERVIREIKIHCTQIFDEETSNCPTDLLECLPLRDSVINSLNRYRRKSIGREKYSKLKSIDYNEKLTVDNENNQIINDHIHYPFVETGTVVEIMLNHKGVRKLNLNGYLLVKRGTKNNNTYWGCQKSRTEKCIGNAITEEDGNGKHILKSTKPHNHIACNDTCNETPQITEIMKKMKNNALTTDESVAKIYDDTVKNLSKELINKLPNKEAIKRVLKRYRLKYRPLDKSSIESQQQQQQLNHSPEVEEILQRMKNRIIKTLEGPGKVYNEEILNVPSNILAKMPKREKILESLKWQKRKTKKHIATATNSTEIGK